MCKPGVRIINAARGGIINEEDLLEALEVISEINELIFHDKNLTRIKFEKCDPHIM